MEVKFIHLESVAKEQWQSHFYVYNVVSHPTVGVLQ